MEEKSEQAPRWEPIVIADQRVRDWEESRHRNVFQGTPVPASLRAQAKVEFLCTPVTVTLLKKRKPEELSMSEYIEGILATHLLRKR